jgi:CDP-glycerol glycerophosphotransferase (TagB/SpsB family)
MLHPKYKSKIKSNKVILVDRSLFTTYDMMKIADYVITDYSALVIDSAIMNKKLLLYVYDYNKYKKENGLNIDLYKELDGNVNKNFKPLMDIISKDKYNMKSFTEVRRKYVNNFKDSCTKELINLIKENL